MKDKGRKISIKLKAISLKQISKFDSHGKLFAIALYIVLEVITHLIRFKKLKKYQPPIVA